MVNKRYHLPKSTLLLLPFKVICYEIDICLLLYTWEEPLKSICVEGIKCLSFEEQKLEAICFCGAKFVEQVPPCFTYKFVWSSFGEQTDITKGLNLILIFRFQLLSQSGAIWIWVLFSTQPGVNIVVWTWCFEIMKPQTFPYWIQ